MNAAPLVLLLVLAAMLSFFMSGMEAGVFALSRLRIRQFVRAGRPRARVLQGYLDQPERFLWTILVGNTLANFVAVGLTGFLLYEALGSQPAWFAAACAGAVFAFYTFCELLPKTLFRAFPNRLCLAFVGPFRIVHLAFSPVVALLHHLSRGLLRWTSGRTFTGRLFGDREELRVVMQETGQGLSDEERAMINRVLDLQHVQVGRVMKPLTTAVTVTTRTPMPEAMQVCRERQLTRLPVWEESAGHRRIAGVLSLKTLLYQPDFEASGTAGDHLKPALYLDADMRLEEALRRMQRSGQRLGIVLDAQRHEVGILTLQDVLETIFGEVSL